MNKRDPKDYRASVERFQRRQARLETRDKMRSATDELLLRVLPPDHPERKRIEGK